MNSPQRHDQLWLGAIITAFGLTALVLLVNTVDRGMLSWNVEQWDAVVTRHSTNAPFSLRILATPLVVACAELLSLSYRNSFIVTQYFSLYTLIVSLAYLFLQYGFSRRQTVGGLVLFSMSYPILCAHFEPNFIWDDFWMYIGLVWTSVFLLKGRIIPATLSYVFAVLNHEVALILSPAFFFLIPREFGIRRLAPSLVAIVVYFSYRSLLFPDVLPGRFTRLLVNFANIGESRQSLYSLFVSFGWVWALAGFSCVHFIRQSLGGEESQWSRTALAGLIAVIICVPVILIAALARESRLFFLPFPFLMPLALWVLAADEYPIGRRILKSVSSISGLILASALFSATLALSVWLFPVFEYLPMKDFHRVYFSINVALVSAFFLALRSNVIAPNK